MSYLKAKMHKIRFWLELCPRLHWGGLQHSPYPVAGFNGPTSKRSRGNGREEDGRERDENGRRRTLEGKGRKGEERVMGRVTSS